MKTIHSVALACAAALIMQTNLAAQDRSDPRPRDPNIQRDGDRPRGERPNVEGARPDDARRREGGEREAQIAKLRAHLEELAAAGKFEEAAEVKRRLAELTERRAPGPGENPEIRQLQIKLHELVEQQRFEEAAQVKRRLEELGGGRGPREGDRGVRGGDRGEPRGGERGDNPEARLREMMMQAEKLRAAGQNEQADQIARAAGELKRQLGERRERADQPDRGERREQRPEPRPPGVEQRGPVQPPFVRDMQVRPMPQIQPDPRVGELQQTLKEMRGELAELHRLVAELKKQLDEKKK